MLLVSIQFIQIEQYKYIKGISLFSKKYSLEEDWTVESNFVILPLVDFLYFVPEIGITQIASPDASAHIHRILAFFKVVEKKKQDPESYLKIVTEILNPRDLISTV